MLDKVDLNQSLSKDAFKRVMRDQQDRLFELAELVYERKLPAIVLFEGWDAAGKGTNIRTITERLDPRGFKVLATRAAMPHEQNKPWLWRFWMNIPRHGQIAIFDRSWYGRVLVERVAGITAIPDWIRAYEEINAFERTLAADGTVFVKFFLHISKAEQLRRFISLTMTPEDAWQVTADDWEAHRRYDEYTAAINDMLSSTSTQVAPWEVVPATNRYYCQYHVIRTVIHRLEEALHVAYSPDPDLVKMELVAEKEKTVSKIKKVSKQAAKEDARASKVVAKAAQKTEKAGKKKKKLDSLLSDDKQTQQANGDSTDESLHDSNELDSLVNENEEKQDA